MDFGKLLKETRQKKNLSIREEAALLDISETQIYRLEANAVNKPHRSTLQTFCAYLNLDFNEVLKNFGYPVETDFHQNISNIGSQ